MVEGYTPAVIERSCYTGSDRQPNIQYWPKIDQRDRYGRHNQYYWLSTTMSASGTFVLGSSIRTSTIPAQNSRVASRSHTHGRANTRLKFSSFRATLTSVGMTLSTKPPSTFLHYSGVGTPRIFGSSSIGDTDQPPTQRTLLRHFQDLSRCYTMYPLTRLPSIQGSP